MYLRPKALSGFVAAAVLFASQSASAMETAAVKIANFTFDPPVLTVKTGMTVIWDNEDDIPHTVVATEHAFRSNALDTDDRYSFTFTSPGRYEYFCSLHPHMKGTIVVESSTVQN